MKHAVTSAGGCRRARTLWFCLGGLAATAALAATLLVARTSLTAAAGNVTLIYVGAEDCAPCRAWQNGDGAEFRRSTDFGRVAYFEVKSPRLNDVLKDEHWPEPIRVYRNHMKRSDGVPLWLVVSKEQVIERRFGAAAWHTNILPAIRSVLR